MMHTRSVHANRNAKANANTIAYINTNAYVNTNAKANLDVNANRVRTKTYMMSTFISGYGSWSWGDTNILECCLLLL